MSITDSLQGVNRLFLDTAPVIYFVEQHPQYFSLVREVFELLRNTQLMGVVSPITLAVKLFLRMMSHLSALENCVYWC